jgi:hypothetical protein
VAWITTGVEKRNGHIGAARQTQGSAIAAVSLVKAERM